MHGTRRSNEDSRVKLLKGNDSWAIYLAAQRCEYLMNKLIRGDSSSVYSPIVVGLGWQWWMDGCQWPTLSYVRDKYFIPLLAINVVVVAKRPSANEVRLSGQI